MPTSRQSSTTLPKARDFNVITFHDAVVKLANGIPPSTSTHSDLAFAFWLQGEAVAATVHAPRASLVQLQRQSLSSTRFLYQGPLEKFRCQPSQSAYLQSILDAVAKPVDTWSRHSTITLSRADKATGRFYAPPLGSAGSTHRMSGTFWRLSCGSLVCITVLSDQQPWC
ncbi:hypothetical protein IAQ61_004824 [Plenodomus lingam]|uniref:uncharacterized protein n=1 Tax=Leptosphaeria maculans TaxID=5022 RepID=UPI0033216860|nr:hypothetical protein IAQ61_004824 [Plenodomus lingam]